MFEGPRRDVPSMRVQVKSISTETKNVTKRGRAVSLVRDATFEARDDTWVLFVLADLNGLTFEKTWLVPAVDFADLTKVNSRGNRRFADSLESKPSKWTRYRRDTRLELAHYIAEQLQAG